MKLDITTSSVDETIKLGQKIGEKLSGGEVIDLRSDLGGGKTSFVKGLAKGLLVGDVIASPSFTINLSYPARDSITLEHFDFYRLNEGGIVASELAENLADDRTIVVVEWADVVENVLPSERIIIKIKTVAENIRQFKIEYPEKFSYCLENIK